MSHFSHSDDSMYSGKPHTNSNLAWHRPQSEHARKEKELMENSARALSLTSYPIEKLRLLCFMRGTSWILGLGRVLRKMDEDGSNRLNKEQFVAAIKETELEISDEDVEELFTKFDPENRDSIKIDEFLKQLRPPMSEMRVSIVEKAFKKLDKNGDGVISVQDIRRLYCCDSNSRYMNGDDTADKILDRFLSNFDTEGTGDGLVTLEEFMSYYSGISVSTDNDCFFDLMLRQAYKL